MNGIVQDEMSFLAELVAGRCMAADIGCFTGESTVAILDAMHPEGKLIAIDTFQGTSGGPVVEGISCHDQIQDILNRTDRFGGRCSIIIGWCENIAPLIQDGSLDFVFLDASHNYSAIRRDIDQWMPKVMSGGILAGHDFECRASDCDRVTMLEHCEEDYTENGGKHYGVILAVSEAFPDVEFQRRIWWVEIE